jgi:hypothetical protein
MKMVKIDEETHRQLVAFNAYLTLQKNRRTTFDDAIKELLNLAYAQHYRERVLEKKEA